MNDMMAAFQGMRDQAASGQGAAQGAPQLDAAPEVQASVDGQQVPFGSVTIDSGIEQQANDLVSQFPSLKPSSGFRDAQTNKREKGVDRSWHLKGRAVDFKGPLKDLYQAAAAAKQAGAAEALVHNAGDGMILHVAWGM